MFIVGFVSDAIIIIFYLLHSENIFLLFLISDVLRSLLLYVNVNGCFFYYILDAKKSESFHKHIFL